MKATRIYTGIDRESHFEDINLPLKYYGGVQRLSELCKAKAMESHSDEKDFSDIWRTAPNRQFIVLMDELELEVGNGLKRHFFPGDVLLDEDTTGHGHLGKALNGSRKAVFIDLEE